MAYHIFEKVDEIVDADNLPQRTVVDVLRAFDGAVSLFSPALLLTHGGFDRDPVLEFAMRFPADQKDSAPFSVDLKADTPEVFFTKLGLSKLPGTKQLVNWDKRIYGIAASRAEECFSFLNGIAFSDLSRGFFASSFSYNLSIADPTCPAGTGRLDVKIFAVVSNLFVSILDNTAGDPPVARTIPLDSSAAALQLMQEKNILTNFTGVNPWAAGD